MGLIFNQQIVVGQLEKFKESCCSCSKSTIVHVPDMGAGIAWDLREMGSAWGRGVREGLAPQKVGKISSQRSARKEVTWRRKKKEEQVGRDEEGPARTE